MMKYNNFVIFEIDFSTHFDCKNGAVIVRRKISGTESGVTRIFTSEKVKTSNVFLFARILIYSLTNLQLLSALQGNQLLMVFDILNSLLRSFILLPCPTLFLTILHLSQHCLGLVIKVHYFLILSS